MVTSDTPRREDSRSKKHIISFLNLNHRPEVNRVQMESTPAEKKALYWKLWKSPTIEEDVRIHGEAQVSQWWTSASSR